MSKVSSEAAFRDHCDRRRKAIVDDIARLVVDGSPKGITLLREYCNNIMTTKPSSTFVLDGVEYSSRALELLKQHVEHAVVPLLKTVAPTTRPAKKRKYELANSRPISPARDKKTSRTNPLANFGIAVAFTEDALNYVWDVFYSASGISSEMKFDAAHSIPELGIRANFKSILRVPHAPTIRFAQTPTPGIRFSLNGVAVAAVTSEVSSFQGPSPKTLSMDLEATFTVEVPARLGVDGGAIILDASGVREDDIHLTIKWVTKPALPMELTSYGTSLIHRALFAWLKSQVGIQRFALASNVESLGVQFMRLALDWKRQSNRAMTLYAGVDTLPPGFSGDIANAHVVGTAAVELGLDDSVLSQLVRNQLVGPWFHITENGLVQEPGDEGWFIHFERENISIDSPPTHGGLGSWISLEGRLEYRFKIAGKYPQVVHFCLGMTAYVDPILHDRKIVTNCTGILFYPTCPDPISGAIALIGTLLTNAIINFFRVPLYDTRNLVIPAGETGASVSLVAHGMTVNKNSLSLMCNCA